MDNDPSPFFTIASPHSGETLQCKQASSLMTAFLMLNACRGEAPAPNMMVYQGKTTNFPISSSKPFQSFTAIWIFFVLKVNTGQLNMREVRPIKKSTSGNNSSWFVDFTIMHFFFHKQQCSQQGCKWSAQGGKNYGSRYSGKDRSVWQLCIYLVPLFLYRDLLSW